MLRFASLGSGSKGNALLVQSGATRVLVDCGFGWRALSARAARLGFVPAQLDAIIVTHEHSDHVAGLGVLQRRLSCPVYLTDGTRRALSARQGFDGPFVEVAAGCAFSIGDLTILPYAVPHDAREPVQYVIGNGAVRLGVLTDAGAVTEAMVETLCDCEGLVLEFNHDRQMLADGPYPAFLKQRISGGYGHLDNAASAALLGRLGHSRLQHVVAAHLSEKNNTPALVRGVLAQVLGVEEAATCLATQQEGSAWFELGGRSG